MRLLFIFILITFYNLLGAQPMAEPPEVKPAASVFVSKTFFYTLGQNRLPVTVKQFGDAKDIICINLHDDETTSVEATRQLLEKRGGILIEVENFRKRNIKFKLGPSVFQFDPNRIFSTEGIRQTLIFHHKKANERAVAEIEKFSQWLLRLIPENPKCVIALHNNSEGAFSINDYAPGNARSEATRLISIVPEQDSDDFFLTTEKELFNEIKDAGYNVLLQHNENAKDDGSLSIWCGKKNIPYVNCETQHGKLQQYRQMMEMLLNTIDASAGYNIYEYSIDMREASDGFNITAGTKIYFNEKQVGQVKSFSSNFTDSVLTGEMVISKSFKIFSNTDFFLIPQLTPEPIIDIRIDPTREKAIINPEKELIKILSIKKPLN